MCNTLNFTLFRLIYTNPLLVTHVKSFDIQNNFCINKQRLVIKLNCTIVYTLHMQPKTSIHIIWPGVLNPLCSTKIAIYPWFEVDLIYIMVFLFYMVCLINLSN